MEFWGSIGLFAGGVSQWLGRFSFTLYLVHLPIPCSLGTWLLLRLEPALGYNLATLVTAPVFMAASLMAADLVARWVGPKHRRATARHERSESRSLSGRRAELALLDGPQRLDG
jgi:peptidoglycan/LPS O-acetylase OafA/YrhL